MEDNFKVLQEKHGRNKDFTPPMLRLWARTINILVLAFMMILTVVLLIFLYSRSHKQRNNVNRNYYLILSVRLQSPLLMLYPDKLHLRRKEKSHHLASVGVGGFSWEVSRVTDE